ncbi:MAG: hypothetical protein KF722_17030 [Nitrospira sp.]|jgi:uncharacterized protein (TIGR03382 family)|nr:hypothetical protein [Nitrospira sp.]
MNRWPGDGGKEPGLGSGLGLILVMAICCAGVPFLAAGGASVLAGLLTNTGITMLAGLALMILGAVLLRRRRGSLSGPRAGTGHQCCADDVKLPAGADKAREVKHE